MVDKINDIPIKIVNGTPVLIRDIGTAADSAAIQTSIVRVNGREATYIPITRQEGAKTFSISFATWPRSFPTGVTSTLIKRERS